MEKEAKLFHSAPVPQAGKLAPTPVGSYNFDVFGNILEKIGAIQNGLGAEIGVFEGAFSENILRRFSNLTLLCVDPYLEYAESDRSKDKMKACEEIATRRLSPFGARCRQIKKLSVDASHEVEYESLDFVFIDALHTYEAVTEDIEAWFSKVRKGGIIAGHDVSWTGVQNAVEDFLAKRNLAGYLTPSTSDIWFFVKP